MNPLSSRSTVIFALSILLIGLVTIWLARQSHAPDPLLAETVPASCALLDESTIAASQTPPSTKADYDRTLLVLERKLDGGGPTALFLTEAANRRFQRFQTLRDIADLERAEELTARQLAESPENPAALSRRAALRGARHDFAGALADAESAGSVLQQIDALDELGRFAEAEALLETVPENGLGAYLRHARAADNAGNPDRAAELLDAAIQDARYGSLSFMSLAGLLAQRATLALHNGHYDTACAGFTEALSLHPGQVSTLEWLGRWAWHADLQELGFKFIDRAAQLDAQNAALQSLAAEMADALSAVAGAGADRPWAEIRDRYQASATALEQKWPDWYRLQTAETLAARGDVAAAQALIEQEKARRKGREWLAAALAVHTRSGDIESAAAMLKRLQEAGVLHPPVLYRAWSFYRATGRDSAARQAAAGLVAGRIELSPQEWISLQQSVPLQLRN